MFPSGLVAPPHTGGPRSFTPTFLQTPESYRSPPDSRWLPAFPTIHVARRSRKPLTIDCSRRGLGLGLGMGTHADETHANITKREREPPLLRLPPLKADRQHRHAVSPGASTAATGIAAMSLSFIINDDVDHASGNQRQDASRVAKTEVRGAHAVSRSSSSRRLGSSSSTSTSHSSSAGGLGVNAILNTVCAKADCYRTIRGPSGSFCKYHKQSRFCRADGCGKSAKTGGYCISHGGGKRCSYPECSKSAKQGGLCISHGGGKRCSENACTKSALVGGFCSAHGGGRKCKTMDCAKTALLGGYCIAHGGGKRCQVDGCSKSAVGGQLCVSHGGGKRCQTTGCNKGAVRNGVCIRHGAKREAGGGATSSNASGSPSPVGSLSFRNEFSP